MHVYNNVERWIAQYKTQASTFRTHLWFISNICFPVTNYTIILIKPSRPLWNRNITLIYTGFHLDITLSVSQFNLYCSRTRLYICVRLVSRWNSFSSTDRILLCRSPG